MRETKTLEFKESVSASFLKTVSAYANYGSGEIVFGIDDNGIVKGIQDLVKTCLDIENRINDNIDPLPDYSLEINERDETITLRVLEGQHKPYFYKSRAYKRNDSSTVEVDRVELTRLILEGENLSFEELPCKTKNLKFELLESRLNRALGIKEVNLDILKTLELYKNGQGINIAGELLADENSFYGISLVHFGDSINVILDRELVEKESILFQYEKAIEFYCRYYQYEEIVGSYRQKVETVPEEAFREAIANALVHRMWDVDANINVMMFPDRIEIISPGGLPKDISKEDYLKGGVSFFRNRIISTIFFRLGIVERLGTGVIRINEAYRNSERKPIFDISESSIRIILPVLANHLLLSEDERMVFEALRRKTAASSYLAKATGFGKNKVIRILQRLEEQGAVKQEGIGRGIKYHQ